MCYTSSCVSFRASNLATKNESPQIQATIYVLFFVTGRQAFTTEDASLMEDHFSFHIVMKKCPGKKDVLDFLSKHPIRDTDQWMKVKYWVKNKYDSRYSKVGYQFKQKYTVKAYISMATVHSFWPFTKCHTCMLNL